MEEKKVVEVTEVSKEIAEEQERVYQEQLAKHKAANESPTTKVLKKEKKAPVKKSTKTKAKKNTERRIVGVKDLEEEFGMPGKAIRRHLRKMEENKKPRGPEPYQWFSDDPNFIKIQENLKAVVGRQPKLQVK